VNNIFISYIDEKDKAFKKPLFSDDDEDDTNDCDTIEEQWRKDRFKRESYLFKVYIYLFIFKIFNFFKCKFAFVKLNMIVRGSM